MSAALNFDASQVTPSVAPEAKPAGWYICMATASEMKPTKDGTGQYLEFEFTILAPQEYAGQKFFDRLNLVNSNPVAVEIAYKTLSAICHATGVIQVQDSAALHNRPLQLKVSLRPAGPGADGVVRDATNEVKGYKAIDGAVPPATPQYAPPPVALPPQYAPPPVAQGQWAPPAQPTPPQWAPPAAPPAQPAAQPNPPQWAFPTPPAAQPAAQQPAPPAQPAAQPGPANPPPWAQPAAQPAAQPGPAVAPPAQSASVPPWLQNNKA